MRRQAIVERKTSETRVRVEMDLDGTGAARIATTMPFLDHMLTLVARHGFFDLIVDAKGDTEVDFHHTVEDIGITLGQSIAQALGEKKGIARYGFSAVAMDETLVHVTLDISGRAYLVYNVSIPRRRKIRDFDIDLIEHFFQALVRESGMTLHVNLLYGSNPHHILEAVFKAFARAAGQATRIDTRIKGVLSTKGRL